MSVLKKPIIFFIVYYLFVFAMSTNAENDVVQGIFEAKKTVTITNDLGGGLGLRYHCKSKDDDLGDRSLAPGDSWSFRFTPHLIADTLFFCRFSWSGDARWFDIYRDDRDDIDAPGRNACVSCQWKIRETGPCRFNGDTNNFDLCFDWNK